MKLLAIVGLVALVGAGISVNTSLSWGDLASITVVFGAVSGGIQWIISRAIVQPALTKNQETVQDWADSRFATRESLDAHLDEDAREFDRIWDQLGR